MGHLDNPISRDGPDAVLQKTLDYACGYGADCNPIKPKGVCVNAHPSSLKAHCSYAIKNYYHKMNIAGGTCDFSSTSTLTLSDPSSYMARGDPLGKKYGIDLYHCKGVLSIVGSDELHTLQVVDAKNLRHQLKGHQDSSSFPEAFHQIAFSAYDPIHVAHVETLLEESKLLPTNALNDSSVRTLFICEPQAVHLEKVVNGLLNLGRQNLRIRKGNQVVLKASYKVLGQLDHK